MPRLPVCDGASVQILVKTSCGWWAGINSHSSKPAVSVNSEADLEAISAAAKAAWSATGAISSESEVTVAARLLQRPREAAVAVGLLL